MVNINHALTKSICLFALLMIGLFSFNCDENVTNQPSKEHSFEISYPLYHKSVYASQLYIEDHDSLHLHNLLIYSVQFMENQVSGDTLYYKGVFNEYFKRYDNNTISTDSSEITIAFRENWVLLQENKSRSVDKRILTESAHSTTDTTIFFNWDTNYFSMYPRYLQANTQESLFIPGYSALHTFTFTTDQFEKWSDIFGEDSGLRYTICDSVMFYDLTRCIVDFTDPANIVDLSVYANEVQEKGLKFFTEELG